LAGALPWIPLGELTVLSQTLGWFKEALLLMGEEDKEGGEGEGRKGTAP